MTTVTMMAPAQAGLSNKACELMEAINVEAGKHNRWMVCRPEFPVATSHQCRQGGRDHLFGLRRGADGNIGQYYAQERDQHGKVTDLTRQ